MHTLINYIVGVLVAGMILFTVMNLQLRGGQASIDAEQYRAGKMRLLDLIAVMEQDLHNIGSQRRDIEQTETELTNAINYPDTNVVGGKTVYSFEFMAQPTPAEPARQIRYEWWQDGTAELDRGSVMVFTIERKVDGAVTARVPRMITFFDLVLLDAEDNEAVPNAYFTRQILAHLIAISPLGSGEYIEEMHWKKLIAPHNLTRLDS